MGRIFYAVPLHFRFKSLPLLSFQKITLMKIHRYFSVIMLMLFQLNFSQQKTFCNPINIDYGYTPFDVFSKQGKHRATADPVIVNFKDELYLFSTNQEGYWHSPSSF